MTNTKIVQPFDRHNAMLCILEVDHPLSVAEQGRMSQRASDFGRGGPDAETKPKYYLEFRQNGQQIVIRQRGATPAPTLLQFTSLLEELDLKPSDFPSTTTTASSAASTSARSSNKSRSTQPRAAF